MFQWRVGGMVSVDTLSDQQGLPQRMLGGTPALCDLEEDEWV